MYRDNGTERRIDRQKKGLTGERTDIQTNKQTNGDRQNDGQNNDLNSGRQNDRRFVSLEDSQVIKA